MAEKEQVNKTKAVLEYVEAHPGIGNKEVSEALTKQGIKVSPAHVANIKGKAKAKRAEKKAAKAKPAAANAPKAEATTTATKKPAKKEGVNKTQAVRAYLKTNRKASNNEVAEALGKKGIKITANYVANIKTTSKKKRKAVKTVVAKTGIDIPQIKAAFGLLKACGGLGAAKEALAAAEEIKKMV